ncbi:MAG: hypothetical protein L3J24_13515 [Xanthomonadales bacterium]|nr:hypothetical protein [Xanthomonadales bacterium]
MNELNTAPVIKLIQLPLLLLVVGLSFPAQAAFCDYEGVPRLADTIERQPRSDPNFSHCRDIVHLAYLKWENITCSTELNAAADREITLDNWGLDSPPDRHDAQALIYTEVLDMALAGESAEKTQQTALKTCRELERREKGGERISW